MSGLRRFENASQAGGGLFLTACKNKYGLGERLRLALAQRFPPSPFVSRTSFLARVLACLLIHALPDLERHWLLPFFQDVADEADCSGEHTEPAHDPRREAKLAGERAN